MKIAVMSDIHSNSVALNSVLRDIEVSGVDKIICTGDLVGYGPFPNDVVNTVIDRKITSTLGNHDLATFDMDTLIDLGDTANQSIVITLDIMGAREKDYLTTLPKAIVFRGLHFVHASPKDNVRGYIIKKSENEIKNLFTKFDGKICFIGHTHLLA
ncbi:MAG TPA: metallophosphoesterase family protein, partial [Methanofastidiosum sp.]|nr:metallophosphoesterase family protein [Methanofastidiosum sp.]